MREFETQVYEIFLAQDGVRGAVITVPAGLVLSPGQYLAAWSPDDSDAPLAEVLFPTHREGSFLRLAGPVPVRWRPGIHLRVRGPFGRAFELPAAARRLALAGLGGGIGRLLPLAQSFSDGGGAVAIFCEGPLPQLLSDWEAFPLDELPEGLAWADFLAVEAAPESLGVLRSRLAAGSGGRLPCPGQVLVVLPMPCAGLGTCGVCAVPIGRDWLPACGAGPVFDLEDLF